MEKPKIKSYQYLVGQCELKTGIVLKTDKTYYSQKGEAYLVFDSKELAIQFVEKRVNENPEIECWIESSTGQLVLIIT